MQNLPGHHTLPISSGKTEVASTIIVLALHLVPLWVDFTFYLTPVDVESYMKINK